MDIAIPHTVAILMWIFMEFIVVGCLLTAAGVLYAHQRFIKDKTTLIENLIISLTMVLAQVWLLAGALKTPDYARIFAGCLMVIEVTIYVAFLSKYLQAMGVIASNRKTRERFWGLFKFMGKPRWRLMICLIYYLIAISVKINIVMKQSIDDLSQNPYYGSDYIGIYVMYLVPFVFYQIVIFLYAREYITAVIETSYFILMSFFLLGGALLYAKYDQANSFFIGTSVTYNLLASYLFAVPFGLWVIPIGLSVRDYYVVKILKRKTDIELGNPDDEDESEPIYVSGDNPTHTQALSNVIYPKLLKFSLTGKTNETLEKYKYPINVITQFKNQTIRDFPEHLLHGEIPDTIKIVTALSDIIRMKEIPEHLQPPIYLLISYVQFFMNIPGAWDTLGFVLTRHKCFEDIFEKSFIQAHAKIAGQSERVKYIKEMAKCNYQLLDVLIERANRD
jgi:hypothetical protein